MILKLKKINFTAIKALYFYWESISIKHDFFWSKNYKYFIGYLYNDHKIKPLHIMLPRTSAYVKGCDGQANWMYFLIEKDLR